MAAPEAIPPASAQRPPLGAGRKAAFAFLFLALLFLAAEGALRIRERIAHNSWTAERLRQKGAAHPFYVQHPYLGTCPAPGVHYEDENGVIDINSLGYRGAEIALDKPAGVFRIYCSGGSTTFGVGVTSNATTWPALLQQELAARFPGVKFEVINAGCPGWTSAESLINYEVRGTDLGANLVIIFDGYNDLKANRAPGFKPDYSHWKKAVNVHFRDRGAVYGLMNWSMAYLKLREAFQDIGRKKALADADGNVKHDTLCDEGVAAFVRNVRSLAALAQSDGARAVIMTFPGAVNDTMSEKEKNEIVRGNLVYMPHLSAEGLIGGLKRHNQAMRDLASEQQIAILDMERAFPHEPKYFAGDDIHLNDEGSALFARLIADELTAQNLIPRP